MSGGPGWVVSCEHAGREVPRRYESLFAASPAVLDTHRAFDAGAAPLARALAAALGRPARLHRVTRLLVDANRSAGHPRCFSEFSGVLPPEERRRLLERVHAPHRDRVREAVAAEIARHGACIHIGVHTFTPRLNGVERTADVGLLYDPARVRERELCATWRMLLADVGEGWRVRRNYPYRGVSDGLTTTLRRAFPPDAYAGIELEVSHALLGAEREVRAVAAALVRALEALAEAVREARTGA